LKDLSDDSLFELPVAWHNVPLNFPILNSKAGFFSDECAGKARISFRLASSLHNYHRGRLDPDKINYESCNHIFGICALWIVWDDRIVQEQDQEVYSVYS
jgi:hypothetical protein